MSHRLAVVTPTYNRAGYLPALYESLKRQTCKDFVWIVADDGSTDESKELIRKWQQENAVDIHYLYKENEGKHTALNLAVRQIDSELVFIVDSDDWLPERAVETILFYHEKYRTAKGLCGYSFLRFYPDGKVNTAFFPENEKKDTYVNVRINGGIGGDKAEVFFTSVLKQYPFPVFKGEKFVPEDLVWVRMSGPYQMIHINECVYISEYLDGGLTRSGRRMKLRSPAGMMARSAAYLEDPAVNLKTKLKMAMLYQIYRCALKDGKIDVHGGRIARSLMWACRIPGWIIYRIWISVYGVKQK